MAKKYSGIPPKFTGENIPDDFSIAPCGIEDMDRALFNLFDERLKFSINVNNKPKKVPVVFATGERFALTRRKPPIRDSNNALILPIISIRRKNIDFAPNPGNYGTPIATRDQEAYTVKRRLSEKDRDYQNIINKLRLKNQDNVASRPAFSKNDIFPGNVAKAGRVASRRNTRNLSFFDDPAGNVLRNDLTNNIFEIITVPYPEFILCNYEVTFWTQYTIHMNQIIESLVVQFDGQEKGFKIQTPSGYEFVAFFEGQFTSQDNFDNFSNEERIIRYSFNVNVPGFILAPQHPNLPNPFRRYLSAPTIEFGYKQSRTKVISDEKSEVAQNNIDRFILSDVEVLNSHGESPPQRGQSSARLLDVTINPFTGEETKKYVKVLSRNQRAGETVSSSRIVIDLETVSDIKSD